MTETIKEYAEALFLIADENQCIDNFSASLLQIAKLLKENPDYIEFLSSPAALLSKRLSAIDTAFSNRYDERIVSFLKLMCEHKHIKSIFECIDEFEKLKREKENRATATVYSAFPLSSEQKDLLCKKLQSSFGKTVDAVYVTDESLLGGIKVVMDEMTIDGSTKKRLNNVKEVMKDE